MLEYIFLKSSNYVLLTKVVPDGWAVIVQPNLLERLYFQAEKWVKASCPPLLPRFFESHSTPSIPPLYYYILSLHHYCTEYIDKAMKYAAKTKYWYISSCA